MRTSAGRQFIRFLAVGLANTVATYALFVALGLIIAPQIAYAIAFVLGLVWVTLGSSRYVFHARSSPRVLLFAAWYLCLFGLGQYILKVLDPQNVVDLVATSIVLMIVTVPLSFLGGRLLLTSPRNNPAPREGARRT